MDALPNVKVLQYLLMQNKYCQSGRMNSACWTNVAGGWLA